MARYDKYDPKVGGFRAPLAADFDPDLLEHVVAVGLDTDGMVLTNGPDNKGTTGLIGCIILTKARKAGDIVDVMTSGEINEFGPYDASDPSDPEAGVDFGDAGSVYYGHNDGSVDTTGDAGSVRIGHTVEATRLIVRFDAAVTPEVTP